ncbi:MAG: hypothetical protein AB1416_06625 [Actinomycetota bacterium]
MTARGPERRDVERHPVTVPDPGLSLEEAVEAYLSFLRGAHRIRDAVWYETAEAATWDLLAAAREDARAFRSSFAHPQQPVAPGRRRRGRVSTSLPARAASEPWRGMSPSGY